jgi:ribose 5-phosphate isomerase B
VTQVRIGIGCDHAGLELKASLVQHLQERGLAVVDFGTNTSASCDYPDFAHALAGAVESGSVAQGVLVCGTGVGMSMSANRHAGVRAVVCSEPLSARMARKHNDANVLCLGARVIGIETALDILDAFLGASFEGGRHERRVKKIERDDAAGTKPSA